ncbi:MAG: type I-U CRISPR-associated protein Csb2 [Armatimonadota bacterium]|nr:type I-U CRISPR-associated protein Csb2 [Armatimonadota bacterium]
MLCLLFEFTAGRYHATPWGHHVNEGLVEWPPSPWRILRAVLATGYTKLGWNEVPTEMRELVEALAATLPTYRLPVATLGHTRHYMPIKGWKRGVQKTSLVIDAFVRPHGPLGVVWPAETDLRQRKLVLQVLDLLRYLGRAESRVKARLVSPGDLPKGLDFLDVSPQRQGADDEPVRLLAPLRNADYEAWRADYPAAPKDLLAALQIETTTLARNNWSAPPGSQEVVYWRPARAVSPQSAARAKTAGAIAPANTALFALVTEGKRDVLPLMERALPTMALFRRALLSRLGDEGQAVSPELTGKDEKGRTLREGHRHAHFIPLSLDPRNRGRIDHVLVHAPMGFGRAAQQALRRLRKTWAKGTDEIAVTLVGLGDLCEFRVVSGARLPELATSTSWQSVTPFIPPRFLKARGKDSLEGQVRAELRSRNLPDLSGAPIVALPADQGAAALQARRFRHFARTRQNTGAPGPPPGLFHLTLTFDSPVKGPLCLGWGCHFGLGLFAPAGQPQEGQSQ